MKIKASGFILKLIMVLAGVLMLASFSPSLDGRAVVVDEGVMPSGLFAKTVGYLPGDVITVSNAAGTSSVELLVIGALDPSEGVAIMLTPEAAAAVGIKKDSNSIVKITKRNGQDDRVYGNAVISDENEAPAAKTEDIVQEAPASTFVEEDFDQPVAEPVAQTDLDEINKIADEEEKIAAEQAAAEAVTPVAPIEKAESTEDAERRAEDRSAKQAVAEAPSEEAASEIPSEDGIPENPSLLDNEEVVYEDNVVVPSNTEIASAAPFEEDDNSSSVEEPAMESPEAELSDSTELAEDDSDEYEAIVLVPAESNPPVSSEDDEVQVVNEVVSSSIAENDEEDTINYLDDESSAIKEAAPVYADSKNQNINFDKYVVSDLKKGSYYIQIATMNDKNNVQEIVNRYGNNYPISLVSKGKSWQVLAGPLSMDEYAVVLARFKAYGYKDAFLRKIK